jgi:hypothetical protein
MIAAAAVVRYFESPRTFQDLACHFLVIPKRVFNDDK